MVRRNSRRLFFWIAAAMVGVPAVVALGAALYLSYPIVLGGPSVWRLDANDQVAYLIFADQLQSNSYIAQMRHPDPGANMSLCIDANAGLLKAIQANHLDEGLTLAEPNCGSGSRVHLNVSPDDDGYMGGVWCGPLCGEGNSYLVRHFLGLTIVLRGDRWLS